MAKDGAISMKRYIQIGAGSSTAAAESSAGGGTTDYNELENKPAINGITLERNKTASQLNLQEKLTEEQQAAVSSQITAEKVENYDEHIEDTDNPHNVTKQQIGLQNVDNTADLDKPISTATQAALNAKQDTLSASQLAAANSGIDSSKVQQITDNASDISDVQTDVEDIQELIPLQASQQNQLADKDFVNSSVATNTANFIGTFNSLEDLQAYSGTLTNNDYAFVITTDEEGNTVYNRYKYNGETSTWLFEYALNNSSFTAAQWAAIQSGITAALVAQIDTNKDDIETLQERKQNKSLVFNNVPASNWVEDDTYEEYGYKCELSLAGVTAEMVASVIFALAEAQSGNYAPVCETGAGIVTIYSKTNDSITIPTTIVQEA